MIVYLSIFLHKYLYRWFSIYPSFCLTIFLMIFYLSIFLFILFRLIISKTIVFHTLVCSGIRICHIWRIRILLIRIHLKIWLNSKYLSCQLVNKAFDNRLPEVGKYIGIPKSFNRNISHQFFTTKYKFKRWFFTQNQF